MSDAAIHRSTAPANAPGQRLYLQRVTINPGARLDTHYHDGTQVAAVVDGTLTYDMVEGAVEVTRKSGTVETFTAPETISLDEGDAITETVDLVHFGANDTDEQVVILVAALLADGALLATPVPE
jgi:quercetin dioxygenase-like cupin family protein